jgi:hypothetical protein
MQPHDNGLQSPTGGQSLPGPALRCCRKQKAFEYAPHTVRERCASSSEDVIQAAGQTRCTHRPQTVLLLSQALPQPVRVLTLAADARCGWWLFPRSQAESGVESSAADWSALPTP